MMKSIALVVLGVAVLSLSACTCCRKPVTTTTTTTTLSQTYAK